MGLQRNKTREATRPPSRPKVANKRRAMDDECTGIKREQGSKPDDEEHVSKKPKKIPMQSIGTNAASPCSKLYVASAAPVTSKVSESRRIAHSKRDDFEEEDGYYGKIQADFKAQQEARGSEQSDRERKEEFKHLVRTKVFNKVKFILKDADLDMLGPVYNSIIKQMKSKEKLGVNIEQYWTVHRKLVRETLNTKRGAVNGMMKAAFMSKF